MKPYLLSLLCSLFLFSSCCRHTNNMGVQRLVFGSFYGMCAGNCVQMYAVDNYSLAKDDSVKNYTFDESYIFRTTRVLGGSAYATARELITQIPGELLLGSGNATLGCPDCHDQGGIYVEIYNGHTVMKYHIDNDNTTDQSAAVIAFKQKIATVLTQLQ